MAIYRDNMSVKQRIYTRTLLDITYIFYVGILSLKLYIQERSWMGIRYNIIHPVGHIFLLR